MALEGNLNEILAVDMKINSSDILHLIYSPKEFIKDKINKEYSEKTKNIIVNNNYSNLENNLEDFIKEIPEKIKEIENNVNQIEDVYKLKETKETIEKKRNS